MNVLITGISSGIGLALAKFLADRGFQVFGTMRSLQKYEALVCSLKSDYGERIRVIPMDVTSTESVGTGIKKILDQTDRIDNLVCNAGIAAFGSIEDLPMEVIEQQYNTNVLGVLRTLKAVIPTMRKHRAGKIILVSSIASLMAIPYLVNYSATKYAIDALTEGLRHELKNFNIKVSAIRPGDARTRLNANCIRIIPDNSPYKSSTQTCWQMLEENIAASPFPDFIIKKIYYIIRKQNPKTFYTASSHLYELAPFFMRLFNSGLKEKVIRTYFHLDGTNNVGKFTGVDRIQ